MRLAADVAHPAMESLEKYQQLLDQVSHKGASNGDRRSASDCARPALLLWVEAVALALELEQLDESEVEKIRLRAAEYHPEGLCPLFSDGKCRLEKNRPLSCRLRDPRTPPSLDRTHFAADLAVINRQFVSEVFHSLAPETKQLTVAESLLLDV